MAEEEPMLVDEAYYEFSSEGSQVENFESESEPEEVADFLGDLLEDFIEDDNNADPEEYEWNDEAAPEWNVADVPEWDDPLELEGIHGLDSRFFSMELWLVNDPENRPHLTPRDHFLVNLTQNIVNRETYTSLLQRFSWLKQTFNDPHIPTDMKTFWRRMGLQDEKIHYIHVCEECRVIVGETKVVERGCRCGDCGPGKTEQPLGSFIYTDIKAQLEDILQIPGIAEDLRYRFTRHKRDPDAYEDLYDGEGYRRLCQQGEFSYVQNHENLHENINFSFTLWLDHVSLTDSSPAKACPVLLQINELSPHARKRHIILAGVWCGNTKPNRHVILKPIVRQLRSLYDDGVAWQPAQEVNVVSRFAVLIFSADTEDRYPVLRMMRHNAKCGCTFCTIETRRVRITKQSTLDNGVVQNRTYSKCYYPVGVGIIRTDEMMREDMRNAAETRVPIRGVKGISSLYQLNEFRFDQGPIVEPFHNIYEGVVPTYMELIMTTTVQQWFIAERKPENVAAINERMKNIKLPSRVSRRLRNTDHWKRWKGTEWRNFLLFYALPCFTGILKPAFVKHWRMLAEAVFTLNNASFSEQELDEADTKLHTFVQLFYQYFGKAHMPYNIHLLQHLGTTIRNWGPIWANSGAIFEAWHHRMVDFTKASTGRALQIVRRFLLSKFVKQAANDPTVAGPARNAIWALTRFAKWNIPPNISTGQYFLGVKKEFREFADDQEVQIINAVGGMNIDVNTEITHFSKAIIHGTEYRTRHNQQHLSFCNHIVYDGNRYFTINDILSFNVGDNAVSGIVGIVLNIRNPAGNRMNLLPSYMRTVNPSEATVFVLMENIVAPAFTITTHNETLIMRLPNCYETD